MAPVRSSSRVLVLVLCATFHRAPALHRSRTGALDSSNPLFRLFEAFDWKAPSPPSPEAASSLRGPSTRESTRETQPGNAMLAETALATDRAGVDDAEHASAMNVAEINASKVDVRDVPTAELGRAASPINASASDSANTSAQVLAAVAPMEASNLVGATGNMSGKSDSNSTYSPKPVEISPRSNISIALANYSQQLPSADFNLEATNTSSSPALLPKESASTNATVSEWTSGNQTRASGNTALQNVTANGDGDDADAQHAQHAGVDVPQRQLSQDASTAETSISETEPLSKFGTADLSAESSAFVKSSSAADAGSSAAAKSKTKTKVKLSAMGKRLQEARWKDHLTVGVAFNRTEVECTAGQAHCKSLCRWLKLTDKDFDASSPGAGAGGQGSCPLFDWSMESSGYTAPAERKTSTPEAVDCVSMYLRKNVHRDNVGTYVLQLEECMVGLSQEDSEKYGVPLETVAREIGDWKAEQSVRESAAKIELQLQAAIAQGRKAFTEKRNEAEAVANLTSVMKGAKSVDGHYMIDDVRTGREILEKLEPIVALRQQLALGEARGRAALRARQPRDVQAAAVWINVSLADAERLGLAAQAGDAKHIRDDLTTMAEVMEEMREALFQANVSLRTSLKPYDHAAALNETIRRCVSANVTAQVPVAQAMVSQLMVIVDAKHQLQDAVAQSEATLNNDEHGRQGLSDFLGDVRALNTALQRAEGLGVPTRVTASAVRAKAKLEESKGARRALHDAVEKAHVLVLDATSLNYTSESEAIGELSGAVAWAEHAKLDHGLPIARELLKMLSAIRDAKVRMTNAVDFGNASLVATAGMDGAVEQLKTSLREAKSLNMTAGVFRAKEELRVLRGMIEARDDLEVAVANANRTLATKVVPPGAVAQLNASIQNAVQHGLRLEAILAGDQLDRLAALSDAVEDIATAMGLNAPDREMPLVNFTDTEVRINISVPTPQPGLKVTDLPDVPGSRDDGDRDFEEHITRLNRSIATAEHYGLVDPEMVEQLAKLQKLQTAWNMINASMMEGQRAIDSKSGIYAASVHLRSSIIQARHAGLKVGVGKAEELMQDLRDYPLIKDELDAAMTQGKLSLRMKTGMHDALMRINSAMDRADRFDLKGKFNRASELRDTLMAVNEAWLHLRTATVQATVALRLEHGEDAAVEVLEESIAEAAEAGLTDETAQASQLLMELRHMNEEQKSIEAAVMPEE